MSDNTPITGELRELLADISWTEIIDHMRMNSGAIVDGGWLDSWRAAADRACDAIDAIHANLERENESLRRELDRVMEEQDEGPKDADCEVIHVGDMMETERFGVVEVEGFIHNAIAFYVYDPQPARICTVPANHCRHHHAPTVEDVLLEFYVLAVRGKEAHAEDVDGDVLAEYAAKLRLAGE